MPAVAACPGQQVVMQNAVTTGNGTVVLVPPCNRYHVFYVYGAAGISAGAVTLETASDPEYASGWAALVNQLATPTTNPIVVTTTQKTYQYIGALEAVRARITTTGDQGITVIYKGY